MVAFLNLQTKGSIVKKSKASKQNIINAAIIVAGKMGYKNITRSAVAAEAGCSDGLINTYYHTMNQLRTSVMRTAIKTENLDIIAQGIVAKDSRALRVSEELKKKAIRHVTGS